MQRDVWFCAWFNQLRSAYGLYLWGTWLGDEDWVSRALATRDLVMSSPQERGLLPTVFVFGDTAQRCRWVHSHHQGGGPGVYHLFDMSWTVYQLLRWHRDLIADDRTIPFARAYCRGIVGLQRADGSLPAYLDAERFAHYRPSQGGCQVSRCQGARHLSPLFRLHQEELGAPSSTPPKRASAGHLWYNRCLSTGTGVALTAPTEERKR